MDKVTTLATEKGVVLFCKSSCCMCYAVKILFQELGVSAMVHEIDQDPEDWEMEKALMRLCAMVLFQPSSLVETWWVPPMKLCPSI
ncbi:Monothiol glutaredoxin-S9 [Hibiscus syriacus]|uniref:Monothiol glutaredoxin-S9 n=1 Tax=Hibiscus syriacus TaxID=106335 RepID=A0A6A3ABU8_HIBSY|nr:Monothiol glutaredoxin-S9 [Hibiscus syriacus]